MSITICYPNCLHVPLFVTYLTSVCSFSTCDMTALCYRRRRHGGRHSTGLRPQVHRVRLQTATLTRPNAETRRCPRSHTASSQTCMRATRGSGSRSEQALCTISAPIAPEHHRPHNHIHRYAVTYLIQSSRYDYDCKGHNLCPNAAMPFLQDEWLDNMLQSQPAPVYNELYVTPPPTQQSHYDFREARHSPDRFTFPSEQLQRRGRGRRRRQGP